MNTLIQKCALQIIIFMALLVPASMVQAAKVIIAPTEETNGMITAGTMLRHSNHLLHNTTIGEALKSSSEQQVKDLYRLAYELFIQASDAHDSGEHHRAKELAHKSISVFYAADRAHYNLVQRN